MNKPKFKVGDLISVEAINPISVSYGLIIDILADTNPWSKVFTDFLSYKILWALNEKIQKISCELIDQYAKLVS